MQIYEINFIFLTFLTFEEELVEVYLNEMETF